jgi:MOSC domain-containing protein YiiM
MEMRGTIVAVASSPVHAFSKEVSGELTLIAGEGVAGDAHSGARVQHRSRVAVDPAQPNLRQVHLIHVELLDELAAAGFSVAPGQLGENITTRGLDLLGLPRGALLRIGAGAVLEVTGLRNPCSQIEAFRPGLLKRMVRRRGSGAIERLAGIMSIVRHGGTVRAADPIEVELPSGLRKPLRPV